MASSSGTETEAERAVRLVQASMISAQTGEPLGETDWRRWRIEGEKGAPSSRWHPDTPQAILDEHGWLFDFSDYGGTLTEEQVARTFARQREEANADA